MAEQLLKDEPTTVTPTIITSHHRELRDLLVCPEERGKLFYIRHTSLFAHDILSPSPDGECQAEQVCDLRFHPVCLSYGAGLLAAGGLHSELAIRPLHSTRWCAASPRSTSEQRALTPPPLRANRTYTTSLSKSINNSLLVTDARLPGDPYSSVGRGWGESGERGGRTRLWVSNNDHTLTAYEVWIEPDPIDSPDAAGTGDSAGSAAGPGAVGAAGGEGGGCRMELSGSIRLPTALNHASLAPDGRTMLAVGDTPDVFVLNVEGGAGTTMKLTTTLEAADASFSTAWSPDGRKFAVSSQNGQVMVWDVRSTKPLAKFCSSRAGASTRAVKFTPPGAPQELLAFAEGSSNLHVVDAQTFTTHKTYTVPPIQSPSSPSLLRTKRFLPSPSASASTQAAQAPAQPAQETTIPIRRTYTPAHLLLSSLHLAHYAHPSSPPPRSRSHAYTAQLYADLLMPIDYKPPVPWYVSGYGSCQDPEITGVCWDPTGRWVYVGTEGSVVEWEVARPERRWWDDVQFA